jgi:hypothetical protein
MDVAIADLVHSKLYDHNFGVEPKFAKILNIARRLPSSYKPPSAYKLGGELLNKLYNVNWATETSSLLRDSKTFGISLFGDGATIKTVSMVNALGAGVHNSFSMLDVFDCTEHCAKGGTKDAIYIAGLFLPLTSMLEDMPDAYVSMH